MKIEFLIMPLLLLFLGDRAGGAGEILGATQVSIAGNGGSGERLTFISLQLVCQSVAHGSLTENAGGNTLTDDAANGKWANDQFNGANGSFFIEMTSGDAVGVTTNIADTTSGGVLTTTDDLSGLASPPKANDAFVIRPHVTFGKLLPNGGGLLTGPDSTAADSVLMVNASGTVATFFHNGTTWRQNGVGVADDTPIMPERGLVVRRRASAAATLTFFGIAKQGVTVVPVEEGFNLLGTLKSAAAVSLDNLGLFPGVSPGLNATDADNLLIIQPDGAVARYFYLTGAGGIPADGWYDISYNAAGSLTIPPGTSFYLERKSGGAFNWTMPAQ